MKTKTNLQLIALTLGLSFTSVASLHAQLNGSFGLDMGGDSSTGRITAAGTITDISTYGIGVFPQGWRTPFLDIANMIVPVSQFTGINNDGSLVNPLDLIPLRTTSVEIRHAGSGVFEQAATKPEFLYAAGSGNVFTAVTYSNFANSPQSFSSPTGSITYATNTITLKAGKSYRLTFSPQTYTSATTANGFCYYQWENATAGAILATGLASSPGFATYTTSVAPLEIIVTPTVTSIYRVKLTPAYATSQTLGGNIIVQTL